MNEDDLTINIPDTIEGIPALMSEAVMMNARKMLKLFRESGDEFDFIGRAEREILALREENPRMAPMTLGFMVAMRLMPEIPDLDAGALASVAVALIEEMGQ